MTISTEEAATYERAWALDDYARESPGVLFLPALLAMAKPDPRASILDAGCGAGAGLEALAAAGFTQLRGADLVDVRQGAAAAFPFRQGPLWNLADEHRSFDWIYCCDVLEHIPEEFTMLVAARLLDAADAGAFFSICLEPDNFGALVGEPLHKTVRPFVWWRDRLAELGRIVECRDLLSSGLYLVARR